MDVHAIRRPGRPDRLVASRIAALLAAGLFLAGCAAPAASSPAASPSPSTAIALVPSSLSDGAAPTLSAPILPSPAPSASAVVASPASLAPSPATAAPRTYRVVAVGDSILANSSLYCPGCIGFVTKYGSALSAATGHPVSVADLATLGLQTSGLLAKVRTDATRRAALRASDVVMVSIGMNDGPWRHTDDPCDGPVTLADAPDVVIAALDRYTTACATAYAEAYRARLGAIFSTIRTLHGSRPGIFLALDRYDDWIGYRPADLPEAPELEQVAPMIVRAWNTVYCEAARANGFACVDLATRFNGPAGTQPSGDLVVADFTHPSQLGQDAILQLLVAEGFGPLER